MERKTVYKEELEMTGAFVAFHNSWKGAAWMGDLQRKFDETMGKDNRILSTVKLDDNAQDVLYNHPEINRLFAGLLDSYDDLPYRPDTAFDYGWRAFEILMSMFSEHFNWQPKESMSKMFSDICGIITGHFANNNDMSATIRNLNEHCPISGISFMLQRLVNTDLLFEPDDITKVKDTLIVEEQYEYVAKRVANAMGKEFYNDFCEKYYRQDQIPYKNGMVTVNIDLEPNNKRRACLLIKKYLITERKITLLKEYDAFTTAKVMELIISGILYTSRCYRFHGDYFSPFKSNRSSLAHYYEYYYFLIYTYAMFWYLLYCYLDINGIEKFFSLDAVNECVERCLKKLDKLPNA